MTFPVYLLLPSEPNSGQHSIHQPLGDAPANSSTQQQQPGDDPEQVSLHPLQIISSGPVVTTASASLPALVSGGDSSTQSFTAWLNELGDVNEAIPTQSASLPSLSTKATPVPPQSSQSAAAGVLTNVTAAPPPAIVLSTVAAVTSASVTSMHMTVTQGLVQSSASAVVPSSSSSVPVTVGRAVIPVVTPVGVTTTMSTAVVIPLTAAGIQVLAAGVQPTMTTPTMIVTPPITSVSAAIGSALSLTVSGDPNAHHSQFHQEEEHKCQQFLRGFGEYCTFSPPDPDITCFLYVDCELLENGH